MSEEVDNDHDVEQCVVVEALVGEFFLILVEALLVTDPISLHSLQVVLGIGLVDIQLELVLVVLAG